MCNRWTGDLFPIAIFVACLLGGLSTAHAQPANCAPSDLLLVVDHSGSMTEKLFLSTKTKMEVAKTALSQLLSQYAKKLRFGLITFSSTSALRVGVGPNTASQVQSVISSLSATGNTAMKCALQDAIKHYQNTVIPNDTLKDRRRFVVLLTDGQPNNCGTDVISEVSRLRSLSVGGRSYDVKTFVIGFGSGVNPIQLQGMAIAGGTGQYYRADSQSSLNLALTNIANGASKEICDNKDNDCDGKVDGIIETCQAQCGSGQRVCNNGQWTQCNGSRQPTPELCNNVDDNCNGKVDDGLTRSCQNQCGTGQETCNKGRWINCTAPLPQKEICDNKDNNCNGQIDENVVQQCKGRCGTGTQKCLNGKWSDCDTPAQPSKEVCDNKDNDCNGKIDDSLERECSSPCGKGTQKCQGGQWRGCNAPKAKAEQCNGLDDNCNGQIDEQVRQDCTTKCGKGFQACIQGDWSTCSAPQPSAEICDGIDNDCDGQSDNGASCSNGVCEKGSCFRKCSNGECPSGYLCDPKDRICRPKTCEKPCPQGQRCSLGRCVDSDCNQQGAQCTGQDLCIDKKCVKNRCLGIKCADGQYCDPNDGKCHHSCAKVRCASDQSCKNGVCQPDPCKAQNCPGSCKAGQCVAAECPATPCKGDQVCLNGLCVADRCAHITCPQGERCVDGECFGPNGPLPPTKTPDPGTTPPGTTPPGTTPPGTTPPGTTPPGTTPPGTTPPGTDPPGRRRGSSGCLCSSADTQGQGFPFSLLACLLLLPLITRRRA